MSESTSIPTKSIAKTYILPYGIALGATLVLLSFLKYNSGKQFESSTVDSIIGFLAIVALIIFPIYKFNQNHRITSIRTALKIGLGIAVISSLLSFLYMYVYTTQIQPDFFDQTILLQRESHLKQFPDTNVEELNKLAISWRQVAPTVLYSGIFMVNMFLGGLISFVLGAVYKSKNV
jgi:glucan phosphoethanolaminetransferase (alkaline phosphatase superfamily)